MKKFKIFLLCFTIFLSTILQSCNNSKAEIELSQIKNICEFSVMECFYHNVAKYSQEDASGFLFWVKDKEFWVEYSGIIKIGINGDLVSFDISDNNVVTITTPRSEVLDISIDLSTFNEDSFFVAKNSAHVSADDETAAISDAQRMMELTASSDITLLSQADERVQILLEDYIKSIGDLTGIEYTVEFNFIESEIDEDIEDSIPSSSSDEDSDIVTE